MYTISWLHRNNYDFNNTKCLRKKAKPITEQGWFSDVKSSQPARSFCVEFTKLVIKKNFNIAREHAELCRNNVATVNTVRSSQILKSKFSYYQPCSTKHTRQNTSTLILRMRFLFCGTALPISVRTDPLWNVWHFFFH